MKHELWELKQLQSLPLEVKILKTQQRIREWYDYWNGQVFVSFSGGKDSTVLLHLVRELYPDVEAMFVDTGLEFPEIRQFVKSFDNVTICRPKMRFDKVIAEYGYPIISKEASEKLYYARQGSEWGLRSVKEKRKTEDGKKSRYDLTKYEPLLYVDFNIAQKCCSIMKKNTSKQFEKNTGKKLITAQMAVESQIRTYQWQKHGCNAFDSTRAVSNPMSFWTEQDVLKYIKDNNLPISSVYGEVVEDKNGKLKTTGRARTGCIFCGFGAHLEKGETRFEKLKHTHPRQWQYCIGGGEYGEDGMWRPNKEGLGMGHVFDELNRIYGEGFIRYGKDEVENE